MSIQSRAEVIIQRYQPAPIRSGAELVRHLMSISHSTEFWKRRCAEAIRDAEVNRIACQQLGYDKGRTARASAIYLDRARLCRENAIYMAKQARIMERRRLRTVA